MANIERWLRSLNLVQILTLLLKIIESWFKVNRTSEARPILSNDSCRASNFSFTGVKGYLDDVELGKIKQFEKDIVDKIKSEKSEIITQFNPQEKLRRI